MQKKVKNLPATFFFALETIVQNRYNLNIFFEKEHDYGKMVGFSEHRLGLPGG